MAGSPPIWTVPPDTIVDDVLFAAAPANLWHLPSDPWKSEVWPKVTGKGTRGAVLDTGYRSHPDLPTPVESRSFISGQSIDDGNSHGTHVAGTMLGRNGIGVAPDAEFICGKVLSNQGSGGSDGITRGIAWAIDQGADVISMSLGGGGSYSPTNDQIDRAFRAGCLVNAAAGNAGYNGSNTIGWPGKYPGCLCQAAYRADGQIANFSSGGREIDWACPGQDIISCSTGGGYVSMSGTSMATPFGSGLLLLIIELMRREGSASWNAVDAVREFFAVYCKDAGAPGVDPRFGRGIPMVTKIVAGLANNDLVWL